MEKSGGNFISLIYTNAIVMIDSSLQADTLLAGTYQFYLGVEYDDNPAVAGNALVYSPLMTINVVDCITTALSPAKSVGKLSRTFSSGSGSQKV
jgi:hypothetical protein